MTTSFRVEEFQFIPDALAQWREEDSRYSNWPVVYALNDKNKIYIGESLSAADRLKQHFGSPEKKALQLARVVIDETFNKSVCLDLESFLIRLFAGDGQYEVINRNEGITNADYYKRQDYQLVFRRIFDTLHAKKLFGKTIAEIENSDLFKFSPFKALNQDQDAVVQDIVEALFHDLEAGRASRTVIQGEPGTGKTIVAIYLMKLLSDIQNFNADDPPDQDSAFAVFFTKDRPKELENFRVGIVIPQQSLRKTIQNVFKRTPGLSASMVMTPYDVAKAQEPFDLLVVDEAHRLSRRSAQGTMTGRFLETHSRLFGPDDTAHTQLDWITRCSRHQIFLIDSAQSVRPSDVPSAELESLIAASKATRRHHRLASQMRVAAGSDYIGYIKALLSDHPPEKRSFGKYDARVFRDLSAMRQEIFKRNQEAGLARMLAGYAWKWKSKNDPGMSDIDIDGVQLKWNTTDVDWVNSPTSVQEVGSIHTIQGYDLNYAGVIIGPDIFLDPMSGKIRFNRARYFDARGKQNNGMLGIKYTDDDILAYVRNIYAVLLTRGIRGTYVYVCDPALRERFINSL